MNNVDKQELIKIFNQLNNADFDYVLMRNIHNELPHNLKNGKDIDILVDKKDEKKLREFFKSRGYKRINHPHKNNIFLYGADKFEFEYNVDNKILFDLNFKILVRSLDAGQWIPIDQSIQNSARINKRFERVGENFEYWTLSYEDEFIHLVSRSVFDKRKFEEGYIRRLDELLEIINRDEVIDKLKLIFFKYTPHLIDEIKEKNYDKIIENFLRFKNY